MKQYLHITNPLKLSEVRLINQMVKDNDLVTVCLMSCDNKTYKLIFG